MELEVNNDELLSANSLFAISCKYGEINWTVHRKLLDIFKLHTMTIIRELQGLISSKLKLPHFPNQFSYLLDASILATIKRDVRTEQLPKLLEDRRQAIETYLRKLLISLNLQISPELCEFFEFSGLSPQTRCTQKYKEGYLKNRIFDIQTKGNWCWRWFTCWIPQIRHYKTKWFVLRSSYLTYLDHIDQTQPSDVLLFDQHFRLEIENEGSKNLLKPLRITIKNGSKFIEVRPEKNSQTPFWIKQLINLSEICPWTRSHRFNSFAPIRENCQLDWLIDGQEFFSLLVRAIQAAKDEIFIQAWWLSPEVYLLRPASLHPNFRLDRLLQSRAEAGVKIYISVYKELSLALPIDSYHTKVALEALHSNIRVQRHPDHLAGGVLYWAHHEKIIVIDQSVAFVGGLGKHLSDKRKGILLYLIILNLDVAFGRYDCSNHRLIDNHPDNPSALIWTGIDYSNPRIRDFRNVIQHTNPLIDRSSIPRMPWHDVHSVVRGQAARDLARHFIQSWNNVKTEKAMQKVDQIPFLLPRPDFSESNEPMEPIGTCRIQVIRSVGDWSIGCPTENSIYDAYTELIRTSEHFIYIENQFFVTQSSTGTLNEFTSLVKNRIGAALVERILRAHREDKTFKVIIVMPLFPAFEAAVDRPEASSVRLIMQAQFASINKGPSSILGRLIQEGISAPEEYISFFALRTHDILSGSSVTEQVYVHSKMAVFDDKYAIIGSANINDRSMIGLRDSEIALVVEDSVEIPIKLFDGSELLVGKKVQELRIRLWQEHLGLLGEPFDSPKVQILNDPLKPEVYTNLLRQQAAINTQIYRELFHCVPDDSVETWAEYALFVDKLDASKIDQERWNGIDVMENLNLVKGNLVFYPLNFLKKEELSAHILSAEYLLPTEIYL